MSDIDLGHEHRMRFFCWKPDRDLNPQYQDVPDIERAGITIRHPTAEGIECMSAVHFDFPEVRAVFGPKHLWTVESMDPLTLSPSLLCMQCGDHGFVREGKWVPA